MGFRLDARYWFVTFAQCPAEKDDILAHIVCHTPRTPEWVLVCREHHDDGKLHLHCVIDWGERFTCRNPRFLDYTDLEATVYHPKLEPAKHVAKSVSYCYKEDKEPYTYGEIPDFETSESRAELARRVLATAKDPEHLLSLVRESDPLHYVEKIFQWERVAKSIFREPIPEDDIEQRPFNNIPRDIQRWLDTEFKTEVGLLHLHPPGGFTCLELPPGVRYQDVDISLLRFSTLSFT